MIDREHFTAMLFNGPLLQSDICVVLCGEDAEPRIAAGAEFMRSLGAPRVLLSGGRDEPPLLIAADRAKGKMMGYGVSPAVISIDPKPMDTKEQAVSFFDGMAEGTRHVTLVVSPYHAPRAFLTFLAELKRRELDHDVRLLCLPASQCKWSEKPEGGKWLRLELYIHEFEKIDAYGDDVASYADGIGYLAWWEQHG